MARLKRNSCVENSFSGRIFLISTLFTLFMLGWEILTLDSSSVDVFLYFFGFIKVFNIGYILFLVGFSVAQFVILTVNVYATIASTTIPKVFLIAIFSVATFFEYGYSNALGRYSELIDLQTIAFFVTNENIVSSTLLYFSWYPIIPIIGLTILAFAYRPTGFNRKKWVFLAPLLLSFFFYSLFALVLKPQTMIGARIPTVSVSNFFQTVSDFGFSELFAPSFERDIVEPIPDTKRSEIRKKNIILIVEETGRGDHFSVNGYHRKTTPYLEELQATARIENYGVAVSGTTGSSPSGALLLTGMKLSDLPDRTHALQTLPTLFQYAKAMGYKTHFLDGQMTAFWNGSTLDQKYIDNWKNAKYFSDKAGNSWNVDLKIAEEIEKITNQSTGNFIWVWKRGMHYPYFDDFPEGKAIFVPISSAIQSRNANREELTNTYDNGMAYNVDIFFRQLMPIIERDSTAVVIYTADHGESFLEDGKTRTHGGTNWEQAAVPFITAGDLAKSFRKDVPIMHEYVFPTILDLLEVPISARKHEYSLSLLDSGAKFPRHREFWGMDLTKGTPIPFD